MQGNYLVACFQSYIICTSPRSGSTLLCGLLAATGKSGKPDSHFHSPSVNDWAGYYGISPANYSNERDLLNIIFKAAYDRGRGNTGIFGLRLQRKSTDFFLQKLNVIYPGKTTDTAQIQQAFGKTLFIHLTRKNKLKQAISLLKANQTGLWHRAPDGTELERSSAPQDPMYDYDAIAKHITELTDMDRQWASWFTNERLKPLRLEYEHLSTDPLGTLAHTLQRLGLDPKMALDLISPVSKLADETSKNWEKRFSSEFRHSNLQLD